MRSNSVRFAAEIWGTLVGSPSPAAAAGELVRYLTRPGWNGPLYFLLLEPWLQLAGRSELALRLPSALSALAAVALCYALGRNLFGRTAGQLAALLAAVNPYLAWYAGEGKMYTLITAGALLSNYLLLRAATENRARLWAGYTLVTSLLFYSHILTPLLLPAQAGLILLIRPRALRQAGAWLAAGALTLPYLPLLLWQWPVLAQPAQTGFPFVPLPEMVRRLAEVFSRGIIGRPAAFPLALLLGAMTLGMLLAKTRPAVGLLLWITLPVIALYLISLQRPLFTERYLIWTQPAWLLLAAGGLTALAQRWPAGHWLAAAGTLALVASGLVGIDHQWSTPVRADFRGAAGCVSENYRPGDLVLFQIPYLRTTFDYYAPDLDYHAADGPYTNYGDPPEAVANYMQQVTAGHERVWLVLSEAPMWDSRGLTAGWLRDHGRHLQSAALNRVNVELWELPPAAVDTGR